MSASDEIDSYLEGLPADQREALEALRRRVAELVPEAEEAISYGMPAFRYRKRPLVGYKAAKEHLSFFPMSPAVIDAHAEDLAEWSTSKGTIRFTPDHPIPDDLLASLVATRVSELES